MALSAPLHVLKGRAKALKNSEAITLTQALDQVAKSEGFSSWSLLKSQVQTFAPTTQDDLLDYLYPGDLLLIGARPGLGKTRLTLQLLLKATRAGRTCFFFSLDYTQKNLAAHIRNIDSHFDITNPLLKLDVSDEICADYIVRKTEGVITEGALIAVDYLQLLDQNRDKPTLQQQIQDLKAYARIKRCILIFISQIDRFFEDGSRSVPNIEDVRLPNPLDLSLFNKSIFVQDGRIYTSSS